MDVVNSIFSIEGAKAPGPYASVAAAKAAGATTLNYGIFINSIVSFAIVAWAIFLLIKAINELKRKEAAAPSEPTTKDCPYCFSKMATKATRCPACTSELRVS